MNLIPLQRSEKRQRWGLVTGIVKRPEDTSLPTRTFAPNISRVSRNPYHRTRLYRAFSFSPQGQ